MKIQSFLTSSLCTFALLAFTTIQSGCVNLNYMPLKKGQDDIDLSKESIVLITAKVSNQFKINHQPALTRAAFVDVNANRMIYVEIEDEPFKRVEHQYNEYILSFKLKPGIYIFAFLLGCSIKSCHSIFTGTNFDLPINQKINIKANSIVYLGKINAVIRKSNNDYEVRAGSTGHTIIGQALAGFSDGTFDVEFKDNYDEDMKLYLSVYPALEKFRIDKSILPPWKRPTSSSVELYRKEILGL